MLDTHPWERELTRAEKQAARFRKQMEKETSVGFMQMRRELGATAGDVQKSLRQQGSTILSGADADRSIAAIRSLKREDLAILRDKTIFQKLEQLERLAKIWALTMGAMSAARAVIAAQRGEWEKVEQAMETLPFGIGQLVRGANQLKREWSGVQQEVDAYNRNAQASDALTAKIAARMRSMREFVRDISRQTSDQRIDTALARFQGGHSGLSGMHEEYLHDMQVIEENKRRAVRGIQDESQARIEARREQMKAEIEEARKFVAQEDDVDAELRRRAKGTGQLKATGAEIAAMRAAIREELTQRVRGQAIAAAQRKFEEDRAKIVQEFRALASAKEDEFARQQDQRTTEEAKRRRELLLHNQAQEVADRGRLHEEAKRKMEEELAVERRMEETRMRQESRIGVERLRMKKELLAAELTAIRDAAEERARAFLEEGDVAAADRERQLGAMAALEAARAGALRYARTFGQEISPHMTMEGAAAAEAAAMAQANRDVHRVFQLDPQQLQQLINGFANAVANHNAQAGP